MMEGIDQQHNFQHLVYIEILLNELANTHEFRILNAEELAFWSVVKDNDRINLVFNYVKANFREEFLWNTWPTWPA